jgi:hypothetical protein
MYLREPRAAIAAVTTATMQASQTTAPSSIFGLSLPVVIGLAFAVIVVGIVIGFAGLELYFIHAARVKRSNNRNAPLLPLYAPTPAPLPSPNVQQVESRYKHSLLAQQQPTHCMIETWDGTPDDDPTEMPLVDAISAAPNVIASRVATGIADAGIIAAAELTESARVAAVQLPKLVTNQTNAAFAQCNVTRTAAVKIVSEIALSALGVSAETAARSTDELIKSLAPQPAAAVTKSAVKSMSENAQVAACCVSVETAAHLSADLIKPLTAQPIAIAAQPAAKSTTEITLSNATSVKTKIAPHSALELTKSAGSNSNSVKAQLVSNPSAHVTNPRLTTETQCVAPTPVTTEMLQSGSGSSSGKAQLVSTSAIKSTEATVESSPRPATKALDDTTSKILDTLQPGTLTKPAHLDSGVELKSTSSDGSEMLKSNEQTSSEEASVDAGKTRR